MIKICKILKQNAKRLGYEFDYTYLDTLSLAKDLFPEYKKYQLKTLSPVEKAYFESIKEINKKMEID